MKSSYKMKMKKKTISTMCLELVRHLSIEFKRQKNNEMNLLECNTTQVEQLSWLSNNTEILLFFCFFWSINNNPFVTFWSSPFVISIEMLNIERTLITQCVHEPLSNFYPFTAFYLHPLCFLFGLVFIQSRFKAWNQLNPLGYEMHRRKRKKKPENKIHAYTSRCRVYINVS